MYTCTYIPMSASLSLCDLPNRASQCVRSRSSKANIVTTREWGVGLGGEWGLRCETSSSSINKDHQDNLDAPQVARLLGCANQKAHYSPKDTFIVPVSCLGCSRHSALKAYEARLHTHRHHGPRTPIRRARDVVSPSQRQGVSVPLLTGRGGRNHKSPTSHVEERPATTRTTTLTLNEHCSCARAKPTPVGANAYTHANPLPWGKERASPKSC